MKDDRHTRFVYLMFVLLFLGCGSKTTSGECKDYQPIDNCDTGSTYTCIDTDDGCRQCGCVPIEGQSGRIE